ncbi:metal ABC transporter substrate-binding protein [Clostridium sp. LBM24168]
MKKVLSLLIIIVLLSLTACNNQQNNSNNTTYKASKDTSVNLDIMTTDRLLYTVVKTIVKNKHRVNYMFKNRESEINFKFTYDSLNNISKKNLFIYVGAGFEPWVDNFVQKLDKSHVGIINSSRGVKLLSYNRPVKYANTTVTQNPYYFMNIDNYKIILVNIKNAVEDKDPQNRSIYEKNFSDELKKIQSYEKDIRNINENLKDYNFITLNENLAYFTNYNGLKLLNTNSYFGSILPIDPIERKSLQEKLDSSTVLLYTSDSELKSNYDVIRNYHIKIAKIHLFDGREAYEDVIKYNINSLKKIYEPRISNK